MHFFRKEVKHLFNAGFDRIRTLYTFDNWLIDEFDYLKCPCHDTSELHDWAITHDPNGSLTIGGLQSPCPNSRYFADNVDRAGQVIYLFDGMFTTKREKETYYVEIMARRLLTTDNVIATDAFKNCRITPLLSLLQTMLDDLGWKKKLPCSVVHVDKDFHYMHGKQGANDDSSQGQ